MSGAVGRALAVLLGVAVLAAAVVGVLQPQLVLGDPIGGRRSFVVIDKPPPPKDLARAPDAKPLAVDLGLPAPIDAADPDDPATASLVAALEQAVADAGDPGTAAVHVMTGDGQVVFEAGTRDALIPASTAKLVTAALVLAAYGPDHTFTTTVAPTTSPDPQGAVAGSLVLEGGGDPTLVSRTYVDTQVDPDRPVTPVGVLADQLVAAGITRVEGGVIGVDPFLSGPPLADGWPQRYLDDLDATPITGLTVDEGLEFFDEGDGIRARAAADPVLEAAAALTDALVERGVEVVGEPTALREEDPVPATVGTAAEVASPPVDVLLRQVVQRSDNHVADTLFRAVGRRSAGMGSFEDAGALLGDVLAVLELDWSSVAMADGSGLSRASAIPAGTLTSLNYRMTNSLLGAAWQDLMAVSGVSGTLERRLVDTIAELRLRGKTGSLGDVSALTGAVVGPDGQPLYFTVIANELEGPQLASARRLQDLVVLALAAEEYGCTAIPPEVVDLEPGELPPLPTHAC